MLSVGATVALMVSVLISVVSSLGLSPVQKHYIVFLGKGHYSHCASACPVVHMGTGKFVIVEITLQCTSITSREG